MQVSTVKQIMWTNNFDVNKKNLERNSNEVNAYFSVYTIIWTNNLQFIRLVFVQLRKSNIHFPFRKISFSTKNGVSNFNNIPDQMCSILEKKIIMANECIKIEINPESETEKPKQIGYWETIEASLYPGVQRTLYSFITTLKQDHC